MKAVTGVASLQRPERGTTVTIGTFDGVHVGHRALIGATVQRAREIGASAAAVTWDRHPAETLRPDDSPLLLTGPARKLELLAETGLEIAAVLPFDEELASWAPERFVDEVLVAGLGARHVFVGRGWRFGHRAAGNVELLAEIGRDAGFEVSEVPMVEIAGGVASSSRTRAAVRTGDMELARVLLGRPFDYDGEVVPGDDRGTSLGFPTANIAREPRLASPARGVYAGRADVQGSWYPAAMSVGVNPTFGGDPATTPVRLEAHIIDFSGDLYGMRLRIEFWARLRDEIAFDSTAALVDQMGRDVEDTRALVTGRSPLS